MPTHSDATPEEPLEVFGRIKVEVASRMKLPSATEPVLKARPVAVSTVARAAMKVRRVYFTDMILMAFFMLVLAMMFREVSYGISLPMLI